jgi:3-deoxy-D-manno-octulosonic-acid transferase
MTLYSYADVAFIGGGFKYNVHNVLEAAVYGVPVLFGPKIENSQEAKELLNRGGAVLVKDKKDIYKQLRTLFKDDNLRRTKADISFKYVKENLEATEKIISEIYGVL